MNVLSLTDKFAPHAGGTAVVWTEWCRRWPADQVSVITRRFPDSDAFDRDQAFRICRVPYLDIPKVRMPLLWARLFQRTVSEVRRSRPRALNVGQILETGYYAPWLLRRFHLPYFLHTYGEELNAYSRSPRLRQVIRRLLAGASGVTAVSGYTEALLRSRFDFHGSVLRVPPGVDCERFTPGDRRGARMRLGLGDGPLLVTVARLMERKGHDRVLDVLPRLRRSVPDVRYVIAGAGPAEQSLKALAQSRGLSDCVTFLGAVPPDEVVLLMQAADIFVHPNRELPNGDVEGFGIVFLEAGACGTPVIAGNSGGTPDAVRDGETGFLIDPNDPSVLEQRLRVLLEDPALRNRMGVTGREWARSFTWDAPAKAVWEMTKG